MKYRELCRRCKMPDPKKITISPGQGLLILMDHYKDDPIKVERLKKLYLSGATNPDERREIMSLLKDKALSQYHVSYTPETINNDPTRRYFETHLSYETLAHGLGKIDKKDLEDHFESLKGMLPKDKLAEVDRVLKGEFKESDNNLYKEYADYIAKIKSGKLFSKLTPEDREKIGLLAKCSFLGVVNAWHNELPLNIYGTGIYSEKNKGKLMVEGQNTTRNQSLGLMKGHMPIGLDDIARSETEIPYLKPSDQATFVERAQWVQSNFDKLVHPYSNSISGTMLCQLRSHAKLRNMGESKFTSSAQKMEQYSQLLISAMLFNSGGHTLNEFTAPLSLDPVKKEFRTTPGFDKINLESMYLTNNKDAFDAAIKDAIEYNKSVLLRDNLHAQIRGNVPIEPKNPALLNLKIKQELLSTSEVISSEKDNYENKIKNQWFSSLRTGAKKNIFIQEGLNEAIKYIENGDIEKAQERVTRLKEDLVSKFGKNNFWGQPSDSYKLVDGLEKSLSAKQNIVSDYKQQIKHMKEEKMKGSEEKVESSYQSHGL